MDQAVITVSCPGCGEVKVEAADILLVICPAGGQYEFTCPSCDVTIVKDAPQRVIRLLRSADVPECILKDRPPLSADEVEEMVKAITQATDVVDLMSR